MLRFPAEHSNRTKRSEPLEVDGVRGELSEKAQLIRREKFVGRTVTLSHFIDLVAFLHSSEGGRANDAVPRAIRL